jgi:hypothetical protein
MRGRTNQGGSVLTFVIVGVALVALVGGGVYLVNQRNKQGGSQPQPSTSQPSSSPSSPTPPQSGSISPSTNNSGSGRSTPTTGVQQNGRLPATGPTDTVMQLLAISMLIGAMTSYIQSTVRRKRQSALL